MAIDISVILSRNITLVYDSLDLGEIDRNQLRKLLEPLPAPVVMDTPDRIITVWAPQQLVVDIGDNRIRITIQKETGDVCDFPIWETASKCGQLLSTEQLVAFGFNFEAGSELPKGNVGSLLIDRFVHDRPALEATLGGTLVSFTPRWTFERNNTTYDLIVDAIDQTHMKTHLNAHFPKQHLPSSEDLKVSFKEEFDFVPSLLEQLFQ